MYKIIFNNLIIDVMEKPRYVRFLPKSQRIVSSIGIFGVFSILRVEIFA